MGDQIPFGKKGRYGVVHGSIEEKFNPFHLMIETNSRDDFDTDKILQQVSAHNFVSPWKIWRKPKQALFEGLAIISGFTILSINLI